MFPTVPGGHPQGRVDGDWTWCDPEAHPAPSMQRSRASLIALALVMANLLGSAWAAGAFNRTLSLQGYSFEVNASGEGSQQRLTITTRGGKRPIKTITQTVDGQVVGAEVADLNSNSLPEIYVYVQSAGSGSYGQLVAFSVIAGDQLSPIHSTNQTTATPKPPAASARSATSSKTARRAGFCDPPAS